MPAPYVAIGRVEGSVQHINGVAAGSDRVDAFSLGGILDPLLEERVLSRRRGANTELVRRRGPVTPLPGPEGRRRTGVALSLDGRKRGRSMLDEDWVVEPQAQLTYQTFGKSSGSDPGGLVTFDNTDSLIGRLGLRGARTWDAAG